MQTMNMPTSDAQACVVRPAELTDLDVCLALDPSYSTEFVWQMDLQGEDSQRAVTFRVVRLPRSMRVSYPRDKSQLAAGWKRCDGFVVAVLSERIVGYLALSEHAAEGAAWINDLVVERTHRRQGVGTALYNAASEWARSRALRRLLIQVQTKNYPAICFCDKLGLTFCGFNDQYYANQDIAVFFARNLR
jgi:GNAT superfamily N-acetyltransferase